MTYEVIRAFADMTDCSEEFPNGRFYNCGDVYPAQGKVSKARLIELSTTDNTTGVIFIQQTEGDDNNGTDTDTSSSES
jgi:hypothetical protein